MNKHTPDENTNTAAWKTECLQSIDELARQGAHRMILAALQAEVEDYLEHHRALRDHRGHAQVVRNGKSRERTFTLGVGPLQFQTPRVNDRRGGHTFHSAVLPPYLRRSPQLETALPVLYLKGLATGDFQEALTALFGQESPNLSATTITRLLQAWQGEYEAWRKRPLQDKDYIYLWADGVYFGVRLEEEKLACLVLVGVLPDGTKEVIAIEDGYRESKESWASLLRDLRERGMKSPAVATGDGALGFWAA
ncbi:MAG: transposase, partial [Coprothermobacterota bacterium]|nr:transposase [Coprothermobacterota bacterium]